MHYNDTKPWVILYISDKLDFSLLNASRDFHNTTDCSAFIWIMLEEANPRTNAAGETESCDSLDNCTSGDHRQWLFSQNSTSSIHQYLEGNGDLQVSKGADIHCSSVRDVTNRKDEHAFKNCLSWQQIQQIIQKGRLHRVGYN